MGRVSRSSDDIHFKEVTPMDDKPCKSILFYSEGWGLGGIERFIMNDVESFETGRFHFRIFSTHDWSTSYDPEIEKLGGKRYVVFHGRKPNLVVRLCKGIKQWSELLKSEKYDIVHINTMNGTGFLYAQLAKWYRVPIRIVHSHNSDFGLGHRWIKNLVNQFFCVSFSNSSTDNIACSRAAGDFLFRKRPFKILKNGIDVSKYEFNVRIRETIRRRLGLSNDTFLFGSVARLSSTKNPMFQIELLSKLRLCGLDAQLLLVGDGELYSNLLQRAERLKVQKFVHLVGNVDNPQPYLCALDIFTLPSIFEGLPLSMVEASANGLMCMVSDSVQFEDSDFPNAIPLSIRNPDEWVAELISKYSDLKKSDRDRSTLGEKYLSYEYNRKYMANVLSEIYAL